MNKDIIIFEAHNQFRVIDIVGYFAIVGYNNEYEEEISNDIKRMDKGSHLGKILENYRFEGGNYEKIKIVRFVTNHFQLDTLKQGVK